MEKVKSKLNSLLGKIEGASEGIGMLFGVIADPVADGRGISGAIPFMIERIQGWHIPDISKILTAVTSPDWQESYPLISGVTAIGAGWIMGEFAGTVDSRLARFGRIIKKLGVGTAIGALLGAFLWLPAINPSGLSGGFGTGSTYPNTIPVSMGGPGYPHATGTGYKAQISYEKVA